MQYRLSVIFIFLFVSCANERGHKSTLVDNTDLSHKDTLSYGYKHIREISPYFIENGNTLDTSYYEIEYPVFENEKINEAIQPYIYIDRENNAKDAAQAFLEGFNTFVEEIKPENIREAWYKEVQSTLILNTSLFFTLQTTLHEYTGGAHGNHYSLYTVFDIERRTKINLTDLFLSGKLEHLKNIAEEKFRKQEHLSDTSSLAKNYFFESGIFALNDNFGLTKSELIVYYNEYEIKPYSEGVTVIKIPYIELRELLNAKGNRYINSIKQ